MIDLKNVTLCCIDCVDVDRAIKSIEICKEFFKFGEVKLFTSIESTYNHIVDIPIINNIKEYSKFMLFDLNSYINTDFVMICQWDGFIIHPELWTEDFLKYDYIGAPWGYNCDNVGNGGFCIRSKKMLGIVSELSNKLYDIILNLLDRYAEDDIICRILKSTLESVGVEFAPVSIANKFSIEISTNSDNCAFGFHSFVWAHIHNLSISRLFRDDFINYFYSMVNR